MEPDPAALARKVADAVSDLAACLSTDVRIDPAEVIGPLIAATVDLQAVATELSLAAMPVDEEAGLAARRAAGSFVEARRELVLALTRLPVEYPRGTVYGRKSDVTD